MTKGNGKPPTLEWLTVLTTNVIKLAGTALGFIEAAKPEVRPSVIAFCALLVAGAQGLENFAKGVLRK